MRAHPSRREIALSRVSSLRVASSLVASLLVAACMPSCGPSSPPPADAGTDANRAPDAGRPPLAVCGNGFLEPTESCDDEGLEPGDGCDERCRFEPRCGDGNLDPTEACDDGNERSGDGCDGRCASREECGNGVLDLAEGEACDDGDREDGDGCDASCRLERCGDGALDAGESCDDGNLDPLDGCGADCRPRASFTTHTLAITPPEIGCDFTGDGLADNRVAVWLRAARTPFNSLIGSYVGTGMIVLTDLLGLDDPSGRNDDDVALAFVEGWDGDDDPDNNFVGDPAFFAMARDLPAPGRPRWVLHGAIRDRVLDVGGGTVLVRLRTALPDRCDLDARLFPWPVARARLRAVLEPSPTGVTGFRDGLLCGAVPIRSASTLPNPLQDVVTLRGCDGSDPTLADLLLGGTSVLGLTLPAAQPDADLDGDGIEQVELLRDGPNGCQPVVRACIDGDGTRHEGRECLSLPQMADGVSVAIELAGIAARITAIVDESGLCPGG